MYICMNKVMFNKNNIFPEKLSKNEKLTLLCE